jgi:hypothetical protein
VYEARVAQFATERDVETRRSDRQANISLVLAVAALVLFGVALWQQSWALLALVTIPAIGFVASYIRHGRINRRRDHAAALWQINQEGRRRLHRDWANLPLPEAAPVSGPARDLAVDLDLLGRASLQHLLGAFNTPIGRTTLQHWLLQPAMPPVIARRQAAVRELAPRIELRDAMAEQGRAMAGSQRRYEQLLDWAEREPWLQQRPWLVIISWIVPLLTLALLIAEYIGLVAAPLWLIGPAIGLAVTAMFGKVASEIIEQVAERQSVFRGYADMFQLFADEQFTAPELQRLQSALSAGGLDAAMQMRRLARLMPLADIRGWMFFFFIQITTLWDIHLLWLLERWQRVAGQHAREWLTALGELEALSALATLAHDHPEWTFPEIIAMKAPMLQARAIGHPLLPPERCVRNDVAVGPSDTFLLVTGSNMSGKSTLLRALGVNIVLAQAGGPVCAASLRMPPITLATSMRVQDSLEAGVSYFMAELQRLKSVVDAAEQARSTERVLFFLLDEILHGTNTVERQIAARRIISYLLELGAIGAVSTHDLTLADSPELADHSATVHFTETLTRTNGLPQLHFDYRLRPGLATSTNALALVEIVGLPGVSDKITG